MWELSMWERVLLGEMAFDSAELAGPTRPEADAGEAWFEANDEEGAAWFATGADGVVRLGAEATPTLALGQCAAVTLDEVPNERHPLEPCGIPEFRAIRLPAPPHIAP